MMAGLNLNRVVKLEGQIFFIDEAHSIEGFREHVTFFFIVPQEHVLYIIIRNADIISSRLFEWIPLTSMLCEENGNTAIYGSN